MKNKKNPQIKIRLRSIYKSFKVEGEGKLVLDGIDLDVMEGEFVSIVGPSGCGKTTLLNVIAGLEDQDKGKIKLKGIPFDKRLGRIGYMQQKDLLFPWRTVLDNTILGLEIKGVSRSEARQRALELTETFGLKGFENQYPFVLSVGMRQRASFLRSVLLHQNIMLLDEPFGALDALTRHQMQEWLVDLWRSIGSTIILVTHDIDEAIILSDKVFVLSARPSKILMSLNINLPRPRNHKIITKPAFVNLKASLLTKLYDQDLRKAQNKNLLTRQ